MYTLGPDHACFVMAFPSRLRTRNVLFLRSIPPVLHCIQCFELGIAFSVSILLAYADKQKQKSSKSETAERGAEGAGAPRAVAPGSPMRLPRRLMLCRYLFSLSACEEG